ncbi:hypothetical protein [Chloroflexus sp.]|uniref:hypothetical protein n=1 Tax=Chloroflexus sp. TaxID=1904827 RepID=UPI00404B03F1
MNRTMFLISAALTAFVLVVIGGVASRLSVSEPVSEVPTEIVIESNPITVPAIDPTVEALIREREAAYQAALAEAQQRLAEANQRLSATQQQLNEVATEAQAAPAVAVSAAPAVAQAPVAPQVAQPDPVQAPVAPIGTNLCCFIGTGTGNCPGRSRQRDPDAITRTGQSSRNASLRSCV